MLRPLKNRVVKQFNDTSFFRITGSVHMDNLISLLPRRKVMNNKGILTRNEDFLFTIVKVPEI